ncbi:hypothetical protein [Nostoc sp. C110]|uniref:hypothetical protein n=1 Tax=Nostoc sp. C110 TaxID=3349876 RepID=UPI00370D1D26
MQPIKAIAIVLSAMTVGMQNPAAAVINNQASQANLVLVTTKQLTTKQPVLVAINDTYWGPQGDFKISMPGEVTENTSEQLTSVSATRTVYTVIHRDFPEASRIPIPQIRQVLQSAMRETIGGTGKVIRSTNLVIDGHPGLELLMEHSDESLGQYRAFVVNQRLYFMGSLTPDELTTEAVNFFDSFQVYPERIRYSIF